MDEYGPEDDDPSIHHVYGAHRGKRKAIKSVANSVARLQSLQFMRKLSEDPAKLVQFSYLRNVPYGDVVLQTLAVNFWGGPLITKVKQDSQKPTNWVRPTEDPSGGNSHVFDIDGSVYLRKWMRSQTWSSSSSVVFWKNSLVKQGIVLGRNHVVADLNLIERAALTCKERGRVVEKTRATIDAALIKGIPSNIDLFKVLISQSQTPVASLEVENCMLYVCLIMKLYQITCETCSMDGCGRKLVGKSCISSNNIKRIW